MGAQKPHPLFKTTFFTWVNRRTDENMIFERLDRYLGSLAWRLLYPAAQVQSLEFYSSDHRPIQIDFKAAVTQQRYHNKSFRFESHWATESDFLETIERGWRKNENSLSLSQRIVRCKEEIIRWAGERFKQIPRKIKSLRHQLNCLKTHDKWPNAAAQIQRLEIQIETFSSKEEIYWKQRSKVNWLAHGDRNSKYFHACASQRRAKNKINGLVSTHGDWCTDNDSMAEIILDYFSHLFRSDNPTHLDQNRVLDSIETRIDGNMNSILNAPFSTEEVKKAAFDLNPDKAPGTDGMSAFFFQKYWNEVGSEVVTAVLKVLNDGESLEDWNETIITLIPKNKTPITMKDFRPISLCNVCYKILARALTNRLRPIMNVAINESQSAFVPFRLITDNIIIGFETIHWIRNRKKGKNGYAALKLDMSKAYDRVEWSFLEKCMEKLGFSVHWIERMMNCIRTVKYSFALNGEVIGTVNPGRGLRQGDPLSPYLFAICAQGLSSLLNDYEARKRYSGVRIAKSCPPISHLFFADDSLIFFKATMNDCEGIRNCLSSYERASGQLINFEKSSISFSPNTNEEIVNIIKSRLSIPIVQGHDIYLGLPTFSLRSKKLQFRYLIDRVVKRMQGWNSRFFSAGGKETLIKSVLQSIPTYAMSCFRIPTGVNDEIERACSNFWWGEEAGRKKLHWKTWKFLSKPKCMGGMGFRRLDSFNKALLAKQIWRILVNPGSLVARVLKARYFKHQDVMKATLGSNPSYIWRSLVWSRQLLQKGLRWRVGNGKEIYTFRDNWIPGHQDTLCYANQDFEKVNTLIEGGNWKETAIHHLFHYHITQEVLAIPIPTTSQPDSRFWDNDSKGKYSVRNGYKLEIGFFDPPINCSERKDTQMWKFLWSLKIPTKSRIFWWKALVNSIPTGANLRAHHVPIDESCKLCHYHKDTTCHALFWCTETKNCWKGTMFITILKQARHMDIIDVFLWMKKELNRADFEQFAIRTWAVWLDRMRIIHSLDQRGIGIEVNWCTNFLQNYQSAIQSMLLGANNNINTYIQRWTRPHTNHLKMNVDAAVNWEANRFAIGGVVRNHEGRMVLAFGKRILRPTSTTYAELEAINEGMKTVKGSRLHVNEVNSDSVLAVQAVANPEADLSYVGAIASDVRSYFENN